MKVLIQNHFIIENKMKICLINNCDNKVFCKNLCQKHYTQMYRYGKVSRTQNDPNEIIIGRKICEMYLYDKKGRYKTSTFFDLEFLEKVKRYKWYVTKRHRNTHYAGTNITKTNGQHKILLLHQLILPCKKPLMSDHIDGNGLNNKLSNLRKATNRQNQENRIDNRNSYVGITKIKNKYRMQIWINGKNISKYGFNTIQDAVQSRRQIKQENNII